MFAFRTTIARISGRVLSRPTRTLVFPTIEPLKNTFSTSIKTTDAGLGQATALPNDRRHGNLEDVVQSVFASQNLPHLITFKNKQAEEAFYKDVASRGRLAIAEGYVTKSWTCEDPMALPTVITKIYSGFIPYFKELNIRTMPWSLYLKIAMGMFQDKLRSLPADWQLSTFASREECSDIHYNIDVNFWRNALGPKHTSYSTAQFTQGHDLHVAQEQKMKYYAEDVLGLDKMTSQQRSRLNLMDIGFGWGCWPNYLCEKYPEVNVTVLGNASEPSEICLHENVQEIIIGDMHTVEFPKDRKFDFIAMMECEHVGRENYTSLFQKYHDMLKEDGRFVMQSLNLPFEHKVMRDEFIIKYIFPGGYIPSVGLLAKASENANLRMIYQYDWGGSHQAVTYYHWFKNVVAQMEKYDEAFGRIQAFYLATCVSYMNPNIKEFKSINGFRVSTHIFTRNDCAKSMADFYPRGLQSVPAPVHTVDYDADHVALKELTSEL